MVYVASVGLGIPKNKITQEDAKSLVEELFRDNRKIQKLLPVFDNAKVQSRQLVADIEWYKSDHDFKKTNDTYFFYAKQLILQAMDACLKGILPYEAIDAIIFVSSTGIVTPSLDAHVMNERPFREDVIRMPLWGLGCAGGASGLARGFDLVKLHSTKTALIICCELCSLTFQKQDDSMSNLVGTAIFGDGAAAALLIGADSPYQKVLENNKLIIKNTSSYTKKNSLDVMGWNVTNTGFEVIFSKQIPKLIPDLWKKHLLNFLKSEELNVDELSAIIAHPGGRKVLEAMVESLQIEDTKLKYSYEVLKNHGNMSSATVLYVLKQWLEEGQKANNNKDLGVLCALGPGFSSELMLLEWMGI